MAAGRDVESGENLLSKKREITARLHVDGVIPGEKTHDLVTTRQRGIGSNPHGL